MIKNNILVLLTGLLSVSIVGCDNKGSDGFKRTSEGLVYKIADDKEGDKHPEIGDIITIHYQARVGDSILISTYTMNENQPIEAPLTKGQYSVDWVNGVPLMTEGDSAVFLVPADSVMKIGQGMLPPFVHAGDTIVAEVRLISFIDMKAANAKQRDIDEDNLNKYFAENNIQPQKTESGLYYLIEKEGTGDVIGLDKKVTVNYTGKRLDGMVFDSNVDPKFQHTEPFTFMTGPKGQVIKGWNEGVQLLKKGSKAKIFVPSTLGYGKNAPPTIGKDACLIFEIEVLSVEDAPATLLVQ